MTKQNHIISLMTDAITAVIDGNEPRAQKMMLQAVKELSGSVAPSARTSSTRGPKPALNATQVASMIERVKQGESVVKVAEAFGVSYQTAFRYVRKNRLAEANA